MDNLAVARLSEKFKPVQTASYGDDSGVLATFDDEFVKNEFKSEIEGRVVYDHYYMVELQWPGDNTKSFKYRFPITQTHNEYIERFPRQWEAFKNSTQQIPDGTPIEMWPPLDKKRVFELKANKIYTIEQIAALTDANGPVALGLDWRKMRDQAQAYLNPSASAAQLSKLMHENEDKDRRMKILEEKIAALSGAGSSAVIPYTPEPIAQLTPKKRGPKPKLHSTEAA